MQTSKQRDGKTKNRTKQTKGKQAVKQTKKSKPIKNYIYKYLILNSFCQI